MVTKGTEGAIFTKGGAQEGAVEGPHFWRVYKVLDTKREGLEFTRVQDPRGPRGVGGAEVTIAYS